MGESSAQYGMTAFFIGNGDVHAVKAAARQKFTELFGRDLVKPVFIVRQLRVDSGRIAVAELFTE